MSSKSSSSSAQEEAYEETCEQENFEYVAAEPLPGKLLLKPLTVLLEKRPSSWKKSDVMPVVKLLSGVAVVDAAGENFEGGSLYAKALEDLTNYYSEHPDIRAMMADPICVMADISGAQNLSLPTNLYSQCDTSPHLAPRMKSNGVWVFDKPEKAQHFVGWIKARAPGIKVFTFNCTSPVLHY